MDRGVSTVLDVGLACLLVSASAVLLVGTPVPAADPPDAERVGRAILPASITVSVEGHAVVTSVSDVLATAVGTGSLTAETRDAVRARVRPVYRHTSIHATIDGQAAGVAIGSQPDPDAIVDAAVFRIGPADPSGAEPVAERPAIVIVVRTWSA